MNSSNDKSLRCVQLRYAGMKEHDDNRKLCYIGTATPRVDAKFHQRKNSQAIIPDLYDSKIY